MSSEESVLPYCRNADIGVIAYSPMASGVLAGALTPESLDRIHETDWRKTEPEFLKFFSEDTWPQTKDLLDRLREIGEAHKVGPGAVAVAWVLENDAVDGAIVGFRRPAQVEDLLPGLELQLSTDEKNSLSELGRKVAPGR
jgi:aryl-alcohol dehydrogenase-like predicted oxidoreductase